MVLRTRTAGFGVGSIPGGAGIFDQFMDPYQPCITRNLDSSLFVAVFSVWKVNNDWETCRTDHMSSLNWLNGPSYFYTDKWA